MRADGFEETIADGVRRRRLRRLHRLVADRFHAR